MERRFIMIFMIDTYLPAKIITIIINLRSILCFNNTALISAYFYNSATATIAATTYSTSALRHLPSTNIRE